MTCASRRSAVTRHCVRIALRFRAGGVDMAACGVLVVCVRGASAGSAGRCMESMSARAAQKVRKSRRARAACNSTAGARAGRFGMIDVPAAAPAVR
jgi:hypothetical protein